MVDIWNIDVHVYVNELIDERTVTAVITPYDATASSATLTNMDDAPQHVRETVVSIPRGAGAGDDAGIMWRWRGRESANNEWTFKVQRYRTSFVQMQYVYDVPTDALTKIGGPTEPRMPPNVYDAIKQKPHGGTRSAEKNRWTWRGAPEIGKRESDDLAYDPYTDFRRIEAFRVTCTFEDTGEEFTVRMRPHFGPPRVVSIEGSERAHEFMGNRGTVPNYFFDPRHTNRSGRCERRGASIRWRLTGIEWK